VRTSVLPGAPIESLRQDDVEWCAAGAWLEHAPTIGACTLGTYVGGVPGLVLPAGGVLGTEEPVVDVVAAGTGHAVRSWWPPAGYPLGIQRLLSLTADGALHAHYDVSNAQSMPLPLLWGLTIPLAWRDDVRLELPVGARTRIAATWGEGLPTAGSEFAWPSLRDGGRLLDLSTPARLPRGLGVLCFVELPQGRFSVRTEQGILEVTGTPGVVTHARVLLDHDAPIPGRPPVRWWRRRPPARAILVGPTVGAPDTLSDAVGGWHAARTVGAGATLDWAVTMRGLPLPLDDA
jgi:hypothetical protein